MPKLSVWLVRASMVHMGVGFLFGSLLLHHKGIPIYGWTWKLLNPHIELMVFGSTMQLVMGVAFFALPRFTHRPFRYGYESLGWLSFTLLNSGVILVAIANWYGLGEVMLIGRLLSLFAVISYVMMIWPRVKPIGIQVRHN